MKKILYGLSVTGILFFLLVCPAEALDASRTGLHLWFDTLLPTLLPFLILSNFLIRAGLVRPVVAFISPVFYRLLRLSPAGTYALVIGFLCGYPMGAKVVSDLKNSGQLEMAEAEYLLGFCNNISPSFIITFLVTAQLQNPALLIPTLCILYGAPLTLGLLQNPSYRRHKSGVKQEVEPGSGKENLCFSLIDNCILDGVITIVKLGGYVMLFAILSGIIKTLPVPEGQKAILVAIMEITNGIPAIAQNIAFPTQYLLLMALTSFGGLSALAQTDSVIKSAHLSLGKYVRSKIFISIIAVLFALCFLR